MLTEHQQKVLDSALDKLAVHKRLIISGNAGVGKTYSVDVLIGVLMRQMSTIGKVFVTAPTHKALSVLRTKVREGDLIEFATVHSALKTKRKINYKTGAISFKPDFHPKFPPLKGVKYMIIDEASMVSKELLELLEEYASAANCTLIFLGDNKQINPVNEEESPVFLAGYPEVELTEIIRQGEGNPIIDLSRNLYNLNFKEDSLVEVDYDDDRGSMYNGYVFSNDRQKAIASLAKVNGTDEIKYLAWTNKEVDSINKDVRKAIYTNPKKIEIGETLVFNGPYAEKYHTNEEVKVKEVVVKTMDLKYLTKNTRGGDVNVADIEMKVYCINPTEVQHNDKSLPPGIIVIHEDSEKDYNQIVAFMKQQCKSFQLQWSDYYHFQDKFADLKYNHAITVHKSQGSTYEKVIMNVGNIKRNRSEVERERLLYTGVTRASDLLILYNA